MSSTEAAPRRWLFGPGPDLLLGCGGAYLLVLALQSTAGPTLRSLVPAGLLILFASVPHYGATLHRVYGSAQERRRYALFAVHGTVLLCLIFLATLRQATFGSWILTLYLTWSPWHYTGQNYGVSLMLLRRRGVPIDPGTKRLIYLSFLLSYVLTFLAIHGEAASAAYAPFAESAERYRTLSLGIPAALAGPAVTLVALAYAGALVGAFVRLLRGAPARDLGPLALMSLTQATWFTVPVLVRHWGLAGSAGALVEVYTAYGFIWVAAAHAVQYLWVTTYYATAADPQLTRPRYLAKTMLAGAAVWFLPGTLFAPGYLGWLSYDAGLALMVAAVVNLHHFVLDGAIWKLREGRVARLLIRPQPSAERPLPATGPRGTIWGISWPLWAVGGAALAIAVVSTWEGDRMKRALARNDLPRLERAARRLAWIGRDSADLHLKLASVRAGRGDRLGALGELERSLSIHPTSGAWTALGQLREQMGQAEQALAAYRSALELEPYKMTALYRGGVLLLELDRPAEAEELLARAALRAPENELVRLRLERARAEARAAPSAELE